MMCTNYPLQYCLMVIFLFAHPTTSLSSLCRCIWRYWTSKMLVRYILLSVCLRLSQYPQLSFMQYTGLCVFSLPMFLMMIVRICVLYLIIIIKLEVWPIWHCLGLGHETTVCTICFSIFLSTTTIQSPDSLWLMFLVCGVCISKWIFLSYFFSKC